MTKILLTKDNIKNFSILCTSATEKKLAIQLFLSFGFDAPKEEFWRNGNTFPNGKYVYFSEDNKLIQGNDNNQNTAVNFSDIKNKSIFIKQPKWKSCWKE